MSLDAQVETAGACLTVVALTWPEAALIAVLFFPLLHAFVSPVTVL